VPLLDVETAGIIALPKVQRVSNSCVRQGDQPVFIEKRRRVYYALQSIPPSMQEAMGKVRFVQSLKTGDHATAERRASILKVQWLSQLAKARKGTGVAVASDAEFWRKAIAEAPENQQEVLRDTLADEARERVDRAAARQGITDTRDPRYQELPELQEATRFVQIATGQLLPFDAHLDDWIATFREEPKTSAMKRADVMEFAQQFLFVQDVTRKGVQQWVNKLSSSGLAAPTISRKLAKVRGYWTYLGSIQAVPEDDTSFEKLSLPRGSARASNGRPVRTAFTATEVVHLLHLAEQREDTTLATLIRLGMYTGARIEELCSVKFEDVRANHFEVVDSKSQAGCRTVPIHSLLKPVLDRLVAAARTRKNDPYIIGGQRGDQYNIRSGALGKRFGYLKRAAGHGEELVFHSLRKTVATLLENAGVPEGIAADILGHEKKTLSYGLYSSGSSMQRKREAIEKLVYPGASL
jgi:integrase